MHHRGETRSLDRRDGACTRDAGTRECQGFHFRKTQQTYRDDHQCDQYLDEAETSRSARTAQPRRVLALAVHRQVVPGAPDRTVPSMPEFAVAAPLMIRQRVHCALAVASCSVIVTPSCAATLPIAPEEANPSRLNVTASTPKFASKVSLPLNGVWLRRIGLVGTTVCVLLGSGNTIQPLCHEVLPEQLGGVAVGFADAQMVIGSPSLSASLRAYCISPSRPLTSVETRFDVVTYWKPGTAIVAKIATMTMTMTNSSRVKPELRFMLVVRLSASWERTLGA